MSPKVTGSTTAARNDAASAVKSRNTRLGVEYIHAAINALADAIDDLDKRIGSETSAVSASIAECHEHAEECARHAKFAATLQLREDYLNLERGWIKFARTIEASERFITAVDQDKKNPE